MDEHRNECPLEKIVCPFAEEGCNPKDLLRQDKDKHMESNVVKHQLLMLKRTKEREKEWSQRSAAIVKNLDSLVFSCTDDQMLPLQSIRSLIDNSYCLKEEDDSLVIDMAKFSTYKRSKSVWYSPPSLLVALLDSSYVLLCTLTVYDLVSTLTYPLSFKILRG